MLHAILLMAFWLSLSGFLDLFHILLGILSVTAVMLINSKIRNYNYFDEMDPAAENINVIRLLYYIPWLLLEVIISSLKVAYLIIHPKMPIKTGIIRFQTNLPHMNAKVLLGNSITLTPGTVTLEINGNDFWVHSMTNDADESHIDHNLTLHVSRLYSSSSERIVRNEKVITSSEEIYKEKING